MHILITGASGFVGKALVELLSDQGHTLSCLSRTINPELPSSIQQHQFDLGSNVALEPAMLEQVDVVIHLAAKVHDLSSTQNPDDYFQTNFNGTQKLLDVSVLNNVKRFIFLSSVKVYGDGEFDQVNEQTPCQPEDPYGESKLQTEQLIIKTAKQHDMEYVILRPPLVFGPGVKANFYDLIKLIDKGIPLPFKNINNQRSLVFVNNLCHLISKCVVDCRAGNHVFVVKDSDISISKLLLSIAKAMNKSIVLFSFPLFLLKLLAIVFGKTKQINRLIGNASVDNQKIENQLQWQPPFNFEQSIQKTIDWYMRK